MKKLIQKLLASRLYKSILRSAKFNRSSKFKQRKGLALGFTLIELLVAALIASLLVTVLLSFLIGVLDSDRKETAKSNAQEELQAAISYISDDLQEATYIYGADALAGINSQLPHTQTSPASTECTSTNCTPVLVFWKRYIYNPTSTGTYSSSTAVPSTQKLGCMPYDAATPTTLLTDCINPNNTAFGRATFTYSLVAYYLKNDTGLVTTWSNTARILRWELKDGYVAYCYKENGVIGTDPDCPPDTKITSRPNSLLITSPVPLADPNKYFILPDAGFNRPDFASAGSLSTLSAGWRKFADFDFSDNPFTTLVDFMDDTDYNVNQGGNNDAGTATSATTASTLKIPIGKNIVIPGVSPTANPDCDDPSVGVGNANPAFAVTQRVPAIFDDATNPSRLSSFYACVAPESVTARIYMRGNALARLGVVKTNRVPSNNNITFFPTADVRSFGRSTAGLKRS